MQIRNKTPKAQDIMKKFIATFRRNNPQLGVSSRKYTIEARTLASATKKANALAEKCVYGSMTLECVEPA